jgi:hypothetical protein
LRGDPIQFRASLVRVVGIDMAERSSLPLSPGQPGAARLCRVSVSTVAEARSPSGRAAR